MSYRKHLNVVSGNRGLSLPTLVTRIGSMVAHGRTPPTRFSAARLLRGARSPRAWRPELGLHAGSPHKRSEVPRPPVKTSATSIASGRAGRSATRIRLVRREPMTARAGPIDCRVTKTIGKTLEDWMNTCALASAANEPARPSPTERSATPSRGGASRPAIAAATRNFAVPGGNVSAASAGENNDLTVGTVFSAPFLASLRGDFRSLRPVSRVQILVRPVSKVFPLRFCRGREGELRAFCRPRSARLVQAAKPLRP